MIYLIGDYNLFKMIRFLFPKVNKVNIQLVTLLKRALNKYLTSCVDQLPQPDIFIEAIHVCGRSYADNLATSLKCSRDLNNLVQNMNTKNAHPGK